MPLLRIMAGPDGEDRLARTITFGDPESVSVDGLQVTVVEDATVRPLRGPLRDARERALGALIAAGARVRRVSLPSWRRAMLPFIVTLQGGSAGTTLGLLDEAGAPRPGWRSMLAPGGPHTLPTRLALISELLPPTPEREQARLIRAGEAIADELRETIGDGVLIHPVHRSVAPRHRRTVGRLWLLAPAAVFNLAGVPVTEVPLGLTDSGLPVGIQVAAGMDRDHVSIAVAAMLERAFGGWVPPRLP